MRNNRRIFRKYSKKLQPEQLEKHINHHQKKQKIKILGHWHYNQQKHDFFIAYQKLLKETENQIY